MRLNKLDLQIITFYAVNTAKLRSLGVCRIDIYWSVYESLPPVVAGAAKLADIGLTLLPALRICEANVQRQVAGAADRVRIVKRLGIILIMELQLAVSCAAEFTLCRLWKFAGADSFKLKFAYLSALI